MQITTRRAGIPDVALKSLSILMVLAFLWACLSYTARNSHFYEDDLQNIYLAYSLPFWSYLTLPIDVHVVPLHRLLNLVLVTFWPYNFHAVLAVFGAFYLASVYLLWKVLDLLAPSRWTPLIVVVFSCNGLILHQFMWVPAALHRLPYVLLSLLSIYCYLRYRDGNRRGFLLGSVLCSVLAVGFYAKAILIPGYLLAIELCLSWRKGLGAARRYLPGLLMLCLSVIYVAWYELFSPALRFGPQPQLGMALEIANGFFRETASVSLAGRLWHPGIAAYAAWMAWGLMVVFSVMRQRTSAVVWLVLIAVLYANFLTISATGRGQIFGVSLVLAPRYYYEVSFLLGIFVALALRSDDVPGQPRPWDKSIIAAVLVVVLFPVYGYYQTKADAKGAQGASQKMANRFFSKLISELDELPDQSPLYFVEGEAPQYVFGVLLNIRMPYSHIVPIRKPNAVFVERAKAEYEVEPSGHVVRIIH
jgi:hypothetical protein